MTPLPREARDGVMRAWLEILREKHPDVAWVPITQEIAAGRVAPAAGAALASNDLANAA